MKYRSPILILTHSNGAPGPGQHLHEWFLDHGHYPWLVEAPLNADLWGHLKGVLIGWRSSRLVNTVIGCNPLNALCGILARKYTVYWSIDYMHERFKNRLLSWFYHRIDAFCARHADETWNLSPRIGPARDFHHRRTFPLAKVVGATVVVDKDISYPSTRRIVYIGSLRSGQGIEESIELAIRLRIEMVVIGDGPLMMGFRERSIPAVRFTGCLTDEQARREVRLCAVGLALYSPGGLAENGDPSKIKFYLSCGVPVLTTPVTWMADMITRRDLGFVSSIYDLNITNMLAYMVQSARTPGGMERRRRCLEAACRWDRDRVFGEIFE